MKIKRIIKATILSLACIITAAAAIPNIDKPIKAYASWHWDFWNDYEDGCLVVWEQVSSLNCYKVTVISADGKRMWNNTSSYVPYWYPYDMMKDMIQCEPWAGGYIYVDIRVDVLNDELHFRRYAY